MNKVLSLLTFVLILAFSSIVSSDRGGISRRTQLLFARHSVNETGFLITPDLPAMADVLRNRSRTGEITPGVIIMYSRHTVTRRHEIRDSRRYISFLNSRFTRPRFWNEDATVAWSSRRNAWRLLYERSGAILRYDIRSECTRAPEHWSTGRRLARRARRHGYVEIDCGEGTLNQFWARRQ